MECDLSEISNKWLNASPDSPGYIDVAWAVELGTCRLLSPEKTSFLAQIYVFDSGFTKLQTVPDSTHLGVPLPEAADANLDQSVGEIRANIDPKCCSPVGGQWLNRIVEVSLKRWGEFQRDSKIIQGVIIDTTYHTNVELLWKHGS